MTNCRPNSVQLTGSAQPDPFNNSVKIEDPQNIRDLMALEKELEFSRTEYLNSWMETVTELQGKLQSLKREVRNDFAMELKDAHYYRSSLFQMEARISELKDSIKNDLGTLLKDERDLSKEILLTERRIEEWGRPLNAHIFKPAVNSSYRIQNECNNNDPMTEFQNFLLNHGGHYGGWDEQDHLLFLRERRKFNGKPKFISALQSVLPDISQNEIEEHEKWYEKYMSLKNKQKEAIKKWRAMKSLGNELAVTQTQELQREPLRETKTKNSRDIVERIKEWKKRQELKKAQEEERQKREMESLAEERIKKKELQKAKKIAVEQYKAEKISRIQNELNISQKIKELQAIEEKARKNILLKAFREQDQQYIERIKSLRTQSASKGKERLERLGNVKPSVEILVERDRQRLLQPTQVWNQHCIQQENHGQNIRKVMDLHSIQHLAIPSWRKGLSNV